MHWVIPHHRPVFIYTYIFKNVFFCVLSVYPGDAANTLDSVIRNDSTRPAQPEVVFPMRSESHGSPPIDRKGTVAIGQSVFYTDFPPKEYGQSGM